MSRSALDTADIISRLDPHLEVEFTFIHTEELSAVLAGLPRERQDVVLEWTRRAAATNTELAFQFANRAKVALFEARREGVHAYCITIDREGQDYLPHMYGAANYTVLDDVAELPTKVSDIYRKITS